MWKRRKEKKNTKNQKKSRDRKGHGASFACFHSHSIRIAETLKTYPAARLLSRMIHARLQTGRHLLLVVSIHGIYERKWFFFDATNRILNESKKKKENKRVSRLSVCWNTQDGHTEWRERERAARGQCREVSVTFQWMRRVNGRL